MNRWPFLYGPESTFLVMARFLAAVAIALVLYYYYLMMRRAVKRSVTLESRSLPHAIMHEVAHYIEVIPLLVVLGLYLDMLFVRIGSVAGAWEQGTVHLAFAASWVALAERRRRQSRRLK